VSVYRVTDLIGTSTQSWEDAASAAIKAASGTLRDLRVAEVVAQDIHLAEDGNLDLSRVVRSRFARSSRNQPVDRGAAFVLVDGGVDLGRAQGL